MEIRITPKAEQYIKEKSDTITIKLEMCGG
ncbi:Uncharacterized [Moorella glycerini]|uniref:Uncharacterized protein n=2 Tax=Neomoorella stamsii TaxID=1266720 RepID=A0A9X7J293_9FIRM|nr:hypothetical protein MOST_18310 [Moorella stamsii]CEP69422.1 Uncharacterized [Moorella glycerini]